MARKRDYSAEYRRRKAQARTEGYRSFWAKRARRRAQASPFVRGTEFPPAGPLAQSVSGGAGDG